MMSSRASSSACLLLILTGLTALGSISVSIYLPSLPSLATSLQASTQSIKLSLTGFLLVFAVSQLIYGPVSDRFGRKTPILLGLAVYIAGSLGCAIAVNAPLLIAARMVQALGAAAGPALGRAVLRDLYDGEKLTRSLAVIAAAVALSPMLGPVVGGYLQLWFGWQSCFVLLTAMGGALALLTYRFLPETRRAASTEPLKLSRISGNYLILLRDQEYVAALLCGGMLTAGNFAWTAGAPFLFTVRFNFSPDHYGNVALIIGSGFVLGTVIGGRLSQRIAAPALVYAGMSLALLGSVTLLLLGPQSDDYRPLVLIMSLFTGGMGIVIPMASACALSRHPGIAGAAAGFLGAVQILTGAMGTLAISLMASPGIGPIAAILMGTTAFSFVAAYVALLPFRNKRVSARQRLA